MIGYTIKFWMILKIHNGNIAPVLGQGIPLTLTINVPSTKQKSLLEPDKTYISYQVRKFCEFFLPI